MNGRTDSTTPSSKRLPIGRPRRIATVLPRCLRARQVASAHDDRVAALSERVNDRLQLVTALAGVNGVGI